MSKLDILLKRQTEDVSMAEIIKESEVVGNQLKRDCTAKNTEKEMRGEIQ